MISFISLKKQCKKKRLLRSQNIKVNNYKTVTLNHHNVSNVPMNSNYEEVIYFRAIHRMTFLKKFVDKRTESP